MQTKKKIKIISDTAEKKPWEFKNYDIIEVSKDSLYAGDYTMAGHDISHHDNSVIIERKKNCLELVTNIGSEWARFEREAEELQKFKFKQIVVCGPNNFDYLVKKGITKLNINFIYRQISLLYVKYGISTIFFNTHEEAENYVFRLFYQIHNMTYYEN